VIGPRIAGTMFAGGVLSWLVLLPLVSIFGAAITNHVPPATTTVASARRAIQRVNGLRAMR